MNTFAILIVIAAALVIPLRREARRQRQWRERQEWWRKEIRRTERECDLID